ncbi:LysE family translocator [Microcella humidisoli]|uniref:LysE family translocator n=1 Tax=Microcella humidisoli TaxID=2963406 RepID=A0ABY5FUW2_9MICO|nr:LysE family translocator [Microcella humidisoli]UTT61685.1 LysE family translocator [Microcella humidisoli]
MSIDTWLIFLVAAIGLSFTPGPNGLLALTHGAIYGVRRTVFTVLGGALGFLIVIAVSMFGIGALLLVAPDVLTVLKWVGGAYLVFLGVQVWRAPAIAVAASGDRPTASGWSLFQQGLLAAVTNPKGILFFVAFLPQFIDPQRDLGVQFIIMASTFIVIEIVFELVVAALSQSLQPLLARAGRWFNRATGGLFILIGVLLPWQL